MTVKYYDICTDRNDAKQIERYYKEINPLHTENNLNYLLFLEISNLDIFNLFLARILPSSISGR